MNTHMLTHDSTLRLTRESFEYWVNALGEDDAIDMARKNGHSPQEIVVWLTLAHALDDY
jgi:hypothetical protein